MSKVLALVAALVCSCYGTILCAADREPIIDFLENNAQQYAGLARALWDKAELGYLERESSALLQETLKQEGFLIESSVAGIPTAFVATYGSGKPVIAVLAEFDALPGISQSAEPFRQIPAGKTTGHACGHHLFGAGSVAAAVAVKRWMEESKTGGTLKLFGTPAEEGGSGKVYMVRAGLFAEVDTVLHWHPADRNMANPVTSLANRSAKFRFYGNSSHAAVSPERGRSALDGVEAMNFMTNMMREHVPQQTRIHYVITDGGSAPNVVPDFAEVFYYVRHPSAKTLKQIWGRVVAAAEGAAAGTGTRLEAEIIHGNHSLLPNEVLAEAMHANLSALGGVQYSPAERDYAHKITATLGLEADLSGQEEVVQPLELTQGMGSTDVGDVSWQVPTTGLRTATWVPGTSPHSWQAIAAGGMSIGAKGMHLAAMTLALTLADLFEKPELLVRARQEFDRRRGPNFQYQALLGDRTPPLDYRLK
ncbi:MAG: amidohydrolase [Halieaceae bacterium]|jgi:aminobenzoyl-glutamate utilization protein B|nr:amidohydrolase [Halieaceae bacterium]